MLAPFPATSRFPGLRASGLKSYTHPPQRFRTLCSRERLLASFGNSVVRLSTANTYSYQKGEGLHPAAVCVPASGGGTSQV